MDASDTKRIVLVGKTGAGKSSLANTMFGKEVFTISHSANSETSKCEARTGSVNGQQITLIDTPGFFDTDRPEEEVNPEIVRCVIECSPGPHAFLIMLKVEKFTKQENDVIQKICEYFSEEVFRYATVLFTHGDQLQGEQRIEDFFSHNKTLSDLVKKCGGRCHVIDNKYWNQNPADNYRNNQIQVGKLLKTLDETLLANKNHCHTNEMLQEVEEKIRKEEENIRKTSENVSEEEIRKRAKDNVHDKLKRVGGVTVLLGAFLSIAVALIKSR